MLLSFLFDFVFFLWVLLQLVLEQITFSFLNRFLRWVQTVKICALQRAFRNLRILGHS